MTKKNDDPKVPASGEQAGNVSYWDALVAEGFVPARVRRRVVVAEGHPEVLLTRYRPGQDLADE